MRFESGLQISSQMGWKCLCGALETPEGLFHTCTTNALNSFGKMSWF